MALWNRRESTSAGSPGVLVPISPAIGHGVHSFRGWTESLSITGRIRAEDRLSDSLNRRELLRVEGPVVRPSGGSGGAPYQALEMALDPFDLEVVLAPVDQRTAEERGARRIHKVRYPVTIEAGQFEIHGVMHLFAGNAPEFAANHTSTLFFPVTEPRVYRGGRLISGPGDGVVLVNRYTIGRIVQVDAVH